MGYQNPQQNTQMGYQNPQQNMQMGYQNPQQNMQMGYQNPQQNTQMGYQNPQQNTQMGYQNPQQNTQMGYQQPQQNTQMGWQQPNWQQQQTQQFQQCQQKQQQQQQKLSCYQQMIQTNPQQLLQMLQVENNFMEAFNNFPILFSYIYKGNQNLFQNIKNIYPQQIQKIMSMYPNYFSQNQPMIQQPPQQNQNPPTGNPGQIQINKDTGLRELLPRNNQTISYNEVTNQNQCVINLTFIASTGNKILICVNGDVTVENLFKMYVRRLNLPESILEKDIMFNFNGMQLDTTSKEKVMDQFRDGDIIQVYDINNIIGA
jgi:PAX-interacting protein 1